MVVGGMRGCGGCVLLPGGMCGCQGGMHGCQEGHAWLPGACMVAGGMHGCGGGMQGCQGGSRIRRDERAVRILLECILVITMQVLL